MKIRTRRLRKLLEGADDRLYVDNDLGLARMIAMGTPGVSSSDSDNEAAGKALSHMRILLRRRPLLVKAFRLSRNRSRAMRTIRSLQRKVQSAY